MKWAREKKHRKMQRNGNIKNSENERFQICDFDDDDDDNDTAKWWLFFHQ